MNAEDWPVAPAPRGTGLKDLVDELFDDCGPLATTYAAVVVHHGKIVAERYGGELEHWDRANEAVGPQTKLLSWSIAKSVLHAVVGMLVADGRLDLGSPAPVPAWREAGDARGDITMEHLLSMRDGLEWAEAYVVGEHSDVIEMLFGTAKSDMAAYAESRPLAAEPGSRFSYSSGTSNIISGIVRRCLAEGRGGGPGGAEAIYRAFLADRVFSAIGMTSAEPGFDEAGTWAASSYLHATARDYARFGYWYLHDGCWGGRRLLPVGWVDHGRRPRSIDPEDGAMYGAHWWVVGDEHGSFRAAGYEGQSILVSPGADLVVVRLGKTPSERSPQLEEWRRRVVETMGKA